MLWIRPGREECGVVLVVRKILGTAVDRNRLKRRLRSVCRAWEGGGGSVVVMPQLSAMRASYADLGRELDELRSRLIRDNP